MTLKCIPLSLFLITSHLVTTATTLVTITGCTTTFSNIVLSIALESKKNTQTWLIIAFLSPNPRASDPVCGLGPFFENHHFLSSQPKEGSQT